MCMAEEQNRVLIDRMATILFCASESSMTNLTLEGFPYRCPNGEEQKILFVGDIMFDLHKKFFDGPPEDSALLKEAATPYKVFSTVHRAENVDDDEVLTEIVAGFGAISLNHQVTLSLHPRTALRLEDLCLLERLSNVTLKPPLPYQSAQAMIAESDLVITDSGGLQKEAYYHRVPCLTLRKNTEWTELVDSGWNRLVASATDLNESVQNPFSVKPWRALYGRGETAKIIAEYLLGLHDPAREG